MLGKRFPAFLSRVCWAINSTPGRAQAGTAIGVHCGSSGTPRPYSHATSCLGQGFGPHYPWVPTIEDGLEFSAWQKKPLMLIIHKSWCPTSIRLAREVARCPKMIRLANYFIMCNLMDDQEPRDKKFMPDGGYSPRILFIAPNGEVRKDIFNTTGCTDYKYFYATSLDVAQAMREALKIISPQDYYEACKMC